MFGLRAGFTTRASCVLAAGITAIVCGAVLGEVDLMRAGVLAAVVPLAAAVIVHRSRMRLTNRRTIEPARASAGDQVTVHLSITNHSPLRTAALMLEDETPSQVSSRARFTVDGIAGRESRLVSYRLPALPRGRYRSGPLRVRLTDPFRMVDVVRSFSSTSEFLVGPIIDPLIDQEPPRSYDIGDNAGSHSVGSHGNDDASTREYRIGDDLRKIHWKMSARTGSLMVRQEERPWQGRTTVLLDTRAAAHVLRGTARAERRAQRRAAVEPSDFRTTSSLEWAISAVGSICNRLMLSGRDVNLVYTPGQQSAVPIHDAYDLRDRLAGITAAHRGELSGYAELVRGEIRDSVLIAVLGDLDETDLRAVTELRAGPRTVAAFAILLDVESWGAADDRGVGDDGVAADYGPTPRREQSASVTRAVRTLAAADWQVVVASAHDSTPGVWRELSRAAGRRRDTLQVLR